LILDEPFDGLDENIRMYVELRLKGYYEDPSKTIILISHNKAEIDSFSDNVFTLLDGKLVEVQQKKFHVEIEKSNQKSQFVLKSGQILKHLTTEMENAILLNETINFTLKPIEQ
jgi:ABC-type sulfate/molybdate transport systems ATPase subunit